VLKAVSTPSSHYNIKLPTYFVEVLEGFYVSVFSIIQLYIYYYIIKRVKYTYYSTLQHFGLNPYGYWDRSVDFRFQHFQHFVSKPRRYRKESVENNILDL